MPTEAEIQAELEAKQNEKVVFDARQQEKVNELLREAQGRAAREVRQEAETLKSELATLKTDLEAAQKAAREAKTPTAKKEANADVEALRLELEEVKNASKPIAVEMERLKASLAQKDQEVQRAKTATIETKKEVVLTSEAMKINPFEVDEVVNATKNSVKLDENTGKWIVIDPTTGTQRLNSAFEPMSLGEFYAEYAAKKPYMVRGTAKTGTGSTEASRYDVSGNGKYTVEQIFGPKSSGRDAQALMTSNPKEYARLRQVAVDGGLIHGKRS